MPSQLTERVRADGSKSYQVRIQVGRKPDGKPNYIIQTFDKKSDAVKFKTKTLRDRDQGLAVVPEKITVDVAVTVIGEASYSSAIWGIATVCDPTEDDLLCNWGGVHTDASCGSISHAQYSYLNWSSTLAAGDYFIWIDSQEASRYGNYALELICTTPTPTPTLSPLPTDTPLPTATPGPQGDDCSNPLTIAMNSQETGDFSSGSAIIHNDVAVERIGTGSEPNDRIL